MMTLWPVDIFILSLAQIIDFFSDLAKCQLGPKNLAKYSSNSERSNDDARQAIYISGLTK